MTAPYSNEQQAIDLDMYTAEEPDSWQQGTADNCFVENHAARAANDVPDRPDRDREWELTVGRTQKRPEEHPQPQERPTNALFTVEGPDRPEFIQIGSADHVYEWHVPSDRFFLSKGARQRLNLGEEAIGTYSDFCRHVPHASLDSMRSRLSILMRIRDSPVHEFVFPFDSFMVRASTIVLRRDGNGLATVIVGTMATCEDDACYNPLPSERAEVSSGFWHLDLKRGTVRLDCACGILLGFEWSDPQIMSLDEFETRIHPDELKANRYFGQMSLDRRQWGDRYTDRLRLRTADGSYAGFLMSGSVLERDEEGSIAEIVGVMRVADVHDVKDTTRNDSILRALSTSGDGVWDWNPPTGAVHYSPRYISMLGYTEDQFPQVFESWATRVHPDDRNRTVDQQLAIASSPKFGDSFECVYRMRRQDGAYAWILGRGYVFQRDASGRALRIVGLHTDITSTQTDRANLEEQLRNDVLSGARSRAFFMSEINRLENLGVRPVSVVMFDLDGLKLVNDHLGHEEGDRIICTLVSIIKSSVRATDCVARLGGDEFVLLLPNAREEDARRLVERIRGRLREHNADEDNVPIRASFGVCSTITPEKSVHNAMLRADRIMLEYKRGHGARFHERLRDYIESRLGRRISLEDERC